MEPGTVAAPARLGTQGRMISETGDFRSTATGVTVLDRKLTKSEFADSRLGSESSIETGCRFSATQQPTSSLQSFSAQGARVASVNGEPKQVLVNYFQDAQKGP